MNMLLKAPSLSHTDMVARNNSSIIGTHDASAMASRYEEGSEAVSQRGSGGGERTHFSMIKHSIGGPFPTRKDKVASNINLMLIKAH